MVSGTTSLITQVGSFKSEGIIPFCQRPKKVYADADELKKIVDAFMVAHDKADADMKRKSKLTEVDEDGFTLVKPSINGEATISSKKRKLTEGSTDFYRFQLKDRKIAQWTEEKRMESVDKAKLNEMKSSGKFQL